MHQIGTNLSWTARPQITGPAVLPDRAWGWLARIWDAACGLPTPGSSDRHIADITLAYFRKHGLKAFYQVGKHGQHTISSTDLGHICDYLEANADVVAAMSAWNEPNNTPDAGMNIDALGALAGVCRHHLHKVKIAGPSSEGFGGLTYLQAFMAKYHSCVDIMDHHFYIQHATGIAAFVTPRIAAYKAVAKEYSKPFWVGEFGLDLRDASGHPLPKNSIHNPQAEQIFHEFTWALINGGVDVPFWWNGDGTDQPAVLVQPGRQALTPEGQSWMKVMAGIQHGQ